jgi:hypothetical protein
MYLQPTDRCSIHATMAPINHPPDAKFFEIDRYDTRASSNLDIYLGQLLIEISTSHE